MMPADPATIAAQHAQATAAAQAAPAEAAPAPTLGDELRDDLAAMRSLASQLYYGADAIAKKAAAVVTSPVVVHPLVQAAEAAVEAVVRGSASEGLIEDVAAVLRTIAAAA